MNHNSPIPHEELEAIERFLANEMTAAESTEFKRRMETDSLLRGRVTEMRLLMVGIRESALTEQLDVFHKQVEHKPAVRMHFRRWLAAAAVVALAGIAVLFFFSGDRWHEKTFAAYYQPDPGLISAMGVADNYNFDKAMVDYKTGNYQAALDGWLALEKTESANDTLQYFIGSAYLALGKAKDAATHFRKVLAENHSPFTTDAAWYLGLALIRLDDSPAAIPFIRQSTHPSRNDLLTKLENK